MAAASSMAFREQLISAASPVPRYRRSTLTKAPRKRTFIANMLKYSASDMPTSGSASAGVATKVGAFYAPLCVLDGGNNNGAGRFSGGGNGGGAGRGEDASGMDSPAPSSFPGFAALVLAVTALTLFAPAGHSVAQEVPAADTAAKRQVSAPRDIVAGGRAPPTAPRASFPPPSAALSWSSASAPVLGPGFGGQIVYGRIHLSPDERLMLSSSVRVVRL